MACTIHCHRGKRNCNHFVATGASAVQYLEAPGSGELEERSEREVSQSRIWVQGRAAQEEVTVIRGKGMYSNGYTEEVILPEKPLQIPVDTGRFLRSRIIE